MSRLDPIWYYILFMGILISVAIGLVVLGASWDVKHMPNVICLEKGLG